MGRLQGLRSLAAVTLIFSGWAMAAIADEEIRLATEPALSPDGQTLAFSWRGDIWKVPVAGGLATRLTTDAGLDTAPEFSPNGEELAFISSRPGSQQVYLMPAAGGTPRQVTHHTGGYQLQGWLPDGTGLLTSAQRDHYWRRPDRFFVVPREGRVQERLLFDDYGADPQLSPDGKKLLFTREGEAWWRKGYYGSQAAQIWLYELEAKKFTKLIHNAHSSRWPLWKPDSSGFYFVGAEDGTNNLCEYTFETKATKQLTTFKDDGVVFPTLSRNGQQIVFRRLFDFYRYEPGGAAPTKIDIRCSADLATPPELRRAFTAATDFATTKDGLEVAFIAGGDVWVMDTELREPQQITNTPEEERDLTFAPSGDALWFVSDAGGKTDLWKAERTDKAKYWWQNNKFNLQRMTDDAHVESQLQWSPSGDQLAYLRDTDLWTITPAGEAKERFKLRESFGYDWSPDSKWLCYSAIDDDYNSDVWIAPLDASLPAVNLSRHPDVDHSPVWSPDGKLIAFSGRHQEEETDIHVAYLRAADFEQASRDRKLESAVEKMTKGRKGGSRSGNSAGGSSGNNPMTPSVKPAEPVVIDWDGLHDRIRRVSIPDSTETNLFWSPDSKKLAFTGTVEGKRGLYSIEFPENLKPTSLITGTGSSARWLAEGNQIVWLQTGVPTSNVPGGKNSTYNFTTQHQTSRSERNRAAFDQCWRVMRDRYYDQRLGNRNWDEIRRKYSDVAASATDERQLATVISLMLGELNGSHLGFTPLSAGNPNDNARLSDATFDPLSLWAEGEPDPEPPTPAAPKPPTEWRPVTVHLGLRFDPEYKGPGLKVKDVIPGGPTAKKSSLVEAGEIVLAIDSVTVDPSYDLTQVLNGKPDRDVRLTVKNAKGEERQVTVRPVPSSSLLSNRLYEEWIRQNRKKVDELSQRKLGYLHIQAMSNSNFTKFDEDLYVAGAGKEGLVIDVRENGGGSIADHLLTALSQPVHAITLGRQGGVGYPQDRKVYATWSKPIIVLCNQNSFSNAEIFAHAIKTLGRGKLVGVPTAGGVISTGSARIMDIGQIRTPGRGWYLSNTGEDFELNGAVPDVILWPEPGQMPRGEDMQLGKAVELLQADVAAAKAKPQPTLKKASERPEFAK
ncbi:S41 family peptidase [Anatilimnocola floriformis]|uniref:S41 family peptidase n=1 Tax=Anatilimnocola floriformis TaxID=2948575 RepID=UPI0020C24605|nr:S41 family peptidase [Anatilimnocola floriformis]